MSGARTEPVVLERAGDLVLRADGPHFEIISNGVFLMDTRNGESERLLVRAALDRLDVPDPSVLIGGLGVGFSLAEAVSTPGAGTVTVVELRAELIGWHATHLRPLTADALADPRVTLLQADLLDHLARGGTRYDAICLDIDNGPDWTVTEANAALYGPDGMALLRRRLAPHGVVSIWSAAASPAFEGLLARHFADVEAIEVPVPRGEPDVIFLAGAWHGGGEGALGRSDYIEPSNV
jgi:spermidine synthase